MNDHAIAGTAMPGPADRWPAAEPGAGGTAAEARPGSHGPARAWLRLFRTELRLVFGRRRNQALLAVIAFFPVLIGAGLRLAVQPGNAARPDGVAFLGQLAGNGIFLAFIALTLLLTLVMPLAMAVTAADSIAGEASHGTLRSLLAVPAGRARILAVKYAVIVVFAFTITFLVTGVALATGAVLFPLGPVTLLSGTTVPLADGITRLLIITLYAAAAMASLGAIGIALSTLTEHAVAAIAALAILVVTSQVADNIPQFAALHPYLPTHWWNTFDAMLRVPADTSTVLHGLVSFGIYMLLFTSLAWARLTTSDITS